MTTWNLPVLSDMSYPFHLDSTQREDLLSLVLGANGITPMDPDEVDEISDRQLSGLDGGHEWGDCLITFTYAVWRTMGDQSLGVVDPAQWLPLYSQVNDALSDGAEGESTPVSKLFASLIAAAKDPKSAPVQVTFDPSEYETAVPAAVMFAGAALQYTAARHPHAPRIKPGSTKLPPKVASLAARLAESVDLSLARD